MTTLLGSSDLKTTYRLPAATQRKLLAARALCAECDAPPGAKVGAYWGPSAAPLGYRASGICIYMERQRPDGTFHRRFAVRPYRGPAAVQLAAAYLAGMFRAAQRPDLPADLDRAGARRAAADAFYEGQRFRTVFGSEFWPDDQEYRP